ncbi:Uncharacterised protein [Bergeyella zoohelcum]|uniref:Uncharacterized protein n=1 Tax=Bergeyella zoohelcum TaxID=1015 RepID=A0A376BYY3_9FLAO|nr:Uncharacterised protein [Bergeyella zoohelcum]
MKKILILLILSVLGLQQSFAQRDTEHWFAPYYEKNDRRVLLCILSFY